MKTFSNYMIAVFMFMYWGFRVIVTYMYETGKDFVTTPINTGTEIILLFVTLVCIILFILRKKIGGIVYAIAYYGYFGVDLFKHIKPILTGTSFNINIGMSMFCSIIAVLLATVVLIDLLLDNVRAPSQKQTDWFYGNKDYDRKVDSRTDRNNYRTGL